jgi:hypothetical protein
MRLVRYGPPGLVRPGMLDEAGRVRDLSYVLYDIEPDAFSPDDIDILRSIEPATLPPVDGNLTLHAPLSRTCRLFCGGTAFHNLRLVSQQSAPPNTLMTALAAVIGKPNWSGAFALATFAPTNKTLVLAPILIAPEPALRWQRLGFERNALETALQSAPGATPGDIVLMRPDHLNSEFERFPGSEH